MRLSISFGICALSLLAIPAPAIAQSDAKVLYLTAYADQQRQISDALMGQIGVGRLGQNGPLSWFETFEPTRPSAPSVPTEQIREDTQRLGMLSEGDWTKVRQLATATSAPVHILFRDGVEFTARIESGELVVIQSAAEIGPARSGQGYRDLFTDRLAVAIPEVGLPDGGSFNNTRPELAVQNIGDPIEPVADDFGVDPDGVVIGADGGMHCGPANGQESTHCALYAVRLMSDQRGTVCTGTLVSDRHILTAAHCLCDQVLNGTLSSGITASVGIPGAWSALALVPEGVHFFDRTGSHICADTGLLFEDRRARGDLAILTVEDGSLANAVERLRNLGVAHGTAGRVRASLPGPGTGPEIWENDGGTANVFVTFGYGVGPEGQAGTKRAMKYTFRRLTDCLFADDSGVEGCDGVQEAIFRDEAAGLCAGDSGSGVFKWADGSRDGFGRWVLMGIVSGYISPFNCHQPDSDELLDSQYERNIVRIDTGLVQGWIDDIVGPDSVWRTTALLTPPFAVAGDGN